MFSRMSFRLRLAAAQAAILLAGCARAPVDVTLLTFNDFHGTFETAGLEPHSRRPWGGALALAAEVESLRRAHPQRTFLLDAGDAWQGTPESNFSFGRSTVGFLNRLGVDAAALGNHEFDWGIDTLRARIAEMHFPMLAANVFEKNGGPPSWARGWAILARDGIRVGVIGFITPDTPKVTLPQNVESLRFAPPEQQVDSLVAHVRAQGAQLVVLLCHIGAEQDSLGTITGPLADLAQRARGVDAIVGGHEHTYVAGRVAGIPVVTAGTKGRGMGRIVLRWNGQRVLASQVQWNPVFADSLPAAPAAPVAAFVDSVCEAIAPLVARVHARTAHGLGREQLVNFVADAMRARTGADVAVTNLGGVRTEFEPGNVTEADLFTLIPFENTLVTARLTGRQLVDFLESDPLQARVAGLRGRYLATAAAGRRLVDITDASGQPMDPNSDYLVATNNFLAHGGDGFRGFLQGRDVVWTEYRVRDVVREALIAAGAAGRLDSLRSDSRFLGTGSKEPARGRRG